MISVIIATYTSCRQPSTSNRRSAPNTPSGSGEKTDQNTESTSGIDAEDQANGGQEDEKETHATKLTAIAGHYFELVLGKLEENPSEISRGKLVALILGSQIMILEEKKQKSLTLAGTANLGKCMVAAKKPLAANTDGALYSKNRHIAYSTQDRNASECSLFYDNFQSKDEGGRYIYGFFPIRP